MEKIANAVDLHMEETNELLLVMQERVDKVDAALEENRAESEMMTAEYDAELKRKLVEIESFKADFASRKKAVDREGKQIQEDKENFMNEMIQVKEDGEAVTVEVKAFGKLVEATSAVKTESFDLKYYDDKGLTSDAYEKALAKHGVLERLYNGGDFGKMLKPLQVPEKPKFRFGTQDSTAGVKGFNIGKK